MDENRRLRSEVEELRNQAQEAPSARDTEQKLELYERLEKSESRILSLERQVRVSQSSHSSDRCSLQQSVLSLERPVRATAVSSLTRATGAR